MHIVFMYQEGAANDLVVPTLLCSPTAIKGTALQGFFFFLSSVDCRWRLTPSTLLQIKH